MLILESIDPRKNRYREYSIDVQPGLFETWTVFTHWGRKGTQGQQKEYLFDSFREAKKETRRLLNLRHRHGYQLVSTSPFFSSTILRDSLAHSASLAYTGPNC